MSELRQDAITHRWAIIAEDRGARPNEYVGLPLPSNAPDCPFCEGNEARTPAETAADRPSGSSPDGPGWSVRSIPNKFPTVSTDASEATVVGHPGHTRRPAHGYHEVVIESPSHTELLPTLATGQARRVFRMIRDRVTVLGSRPGIRSTVAFENSGPESGGTLFHPHAQIVALPEIPVLLAEELAGLARYARSHGGVCALEAEIAREREAGERVVWDRPGVVAYAPFASGHPYEVRVVPVRHAPSLGSASDAEIDVLAEEVPRLLRALRGVAPGASYNLVARGVPSSAPEAKEYHWHLDLIPRLVRPDGFEVGTGLPVNPVPPERAARELRAAVDGRRPSGGPRSDPP